MPAYLIAPVIVITFVAVSLGVSSFLSHDIYYSVAEESQNGNYEVEEVVETQPEGEEVDVSSFTPIRVPTPSSVKMVYMTSCVASTPSLRNAMIDLINETELNSIMIDIKDFSGMISFRSDDPDLAGAYSTSCPVSNMRDLVYSLNEQGIYVAGRVTVFQDSHLAKKNPSVAVLRESDKGVWSDNKGIHFTDPGAQEVWDYHVKIAKESYDLGFDEINFDYIRYPSDGPMRDIYFPHSEGENKADVIEQFFYYLHNELKDTGMVTSADLFGMTTSNTDDLGIGQVWEKALPYFDYIAPMVYPSHYPVGFKGLGNPNHYPYEIINWSLLDAIERTVATSTPIRTIGSTLVREAGTSSPALYSKEVFDPSVIRPWIQDFRYGGTYGPAEVRAQIQATYDAGLNSWMLWDPSNRYTREALESSQ